MLPLSNPLGQLHAAQQSKAMQEYQAARQRMMRAWASLLTIVLGTALLAVAGGIAFGWAGILAGLGLPLFVIGLMIGLFTPSQ